jgi:hypothetical protein
MFSRSTLRPYFACVSLHYEYTEFSFFVGECRGVVRLTLQRYGIRTPLVKGFTKFFRNFFKFFFEGENVCLETPSRLGREGEESVGQSVGQLFEIGYKAITKN